MMKKKLYLKKYKNINKIIILKNKLKKKDKYINNNELYIKLLENNLDIMSNKLEYVHDEICNFLENNIKKKNEIEDEIDFSDSKIVFEKIIEYINKEEMNNYDSSKIDVICKKLIDCINNNSF